MPPFAIFRSEQPVWIAETNQICSAVDNISTEIPVALVYNGIAHAVLMATPQHLPELALGFSLSEGIVVSGSQIYDINVVEEENGLVINIELAAEAFSRLKNRRRNMGGRSGCGLCGLESLAAVKPALPKLTRGAPVSLSAVRRALLQFDDCQPLRAQTGSVHAAAWVDHLGNIQAAFEDVGRHNALDKLIGHLVRRNDNCQLGFVLISSRAGFEMVVKAATAGIGCVVAVSAPTAYAIDLAEEAGITLIGFARTKRQVVYSHPEYLLLND
ncbi:formate dehydrogenase accessory sulfurtransferase FdhD [Stenoxybacter acetivorans]|uniref:formate dehydrogenase accessory sulfurtransferase FdhD n=1 Tax=Stenoxybacter acetivorans TaxID=422441 RepID=UPI000A063B03|nr:formate dehydrogenase accessory sulfurtransferase FdhD [Stenoxybacter acetivorans]